MVELNLPTGSRWKIIERGEDYIYPKTGKRGIRIVCQCSCGNRKLVHKAHLLNGTSKSCGCLNIEISSTAGGLTTKFPREYSAWTRMHRRCNNPVGKNANYKNITICPEWNNFETFLADLGPCPSNFELERKDSTLGYSSHNCEWASELKQAQNRGTYSNNTSGVKGVTWSKSHGKWRVYLYRDKRRYEGGLFDCLDEAKNARIQLEIRYPAVKT